MFDLGQIVLDVVTDLGQIVLDIRRDVLDLGLAVLELYQVGFTKFRNLVKDFFEF